MKNLAPMKNTKSAPLFTDAKELTISRKQARKLAKLAKKEGQLVKRNGIAKDLEMYKEEAA